MSSTQRETHLEFPINFPAIFCEHGEIQRSEIPVVSDVNVDIVDGEEVQLRSRGGLPGASGEKEAVLEDRDSALEDLGSRVDGVRRVRGGRVGEVYASQFLDRRPPRSRHRRCRRLWRRPQHKTHSPADSFRRLSV